MEHSYTHWLWAACGALAMFPLKKLWDYIVDRNWEVFKATFSDAFKKTPGGKQFMDAFYKGRAEKDQKIVAEHPELAKVLHCKVCSGAGCEDCGNTGWA